VAIGMHKEGENNNVGVDDELKASDGVMSLFI
jgi:hypothetical protein